MQARSIYRATLVSSAGSALSAMDHDQNEEQGYWYQGLEVQGGEEYLRYRHFSPRSADAPVYWNWCD